VTSTRDNGLWQFTPVGTVSALQLIDDRPYFEENPMIKAQPIHKLRWVGPLVTSCAMATLLTACNTLETTEGATEAVERPAAPGESSIDAMVAQSMANMKRFMALPEAERQRYVKDSQQRSLAHGQRLYESTQLGTNGFSCATCHPRGTTTGGQVPMGELMQAPIPTLVGAAATFPKFKVPNDSVITLADMNNNCIVMFLQGQPLATDSAEARDLAAYVTRFSEDAPLVPGKQSM
jgi:thiosulfate dehydrogenase